MPLPTGAGAPEHEMTGTEVRGLMLATAVALALAACHSSTAYLNRNRGATVHDVRIVNNCGRTDAVLFLDREWQNRRKYNSRPRVVKPGEPVVVPLANGKHSFRAEFRTFLNTDVRTADFMVNGGNSSLELC